MPDLKQLPIIGEAQRGPLVEQLLVQLEHLLEENLYRLGLSGHGIATQAAFRKA
jgi:hypothetical protein